MTPREYLEAVVRPNVADFHNHFADLRLAHNAVSAVDALAAYLFVWAHSNAPAAVASAKDDSHYRETLAKRDRSFALLRDIAKALKHVHLTRHNPQVAHADQVTSRAIGYGEGGYGEGHFGGVEQVVVDVSAGDFSYLENIVDNGLAFLEAEMGSLGVP